MEFTNFWRRLRLDNFKGTIFVMWAEIPQMEYTEPMQVDRRSETRKREIFDI